ncbi:restriction endonuclease subunit S [Vibrio breoganii]
MMPNGWERTSFGLLAEFRNGLNFTKADRGEAIKIVGVADFKDHSSLSSLDNLGVISVSNTVKDNDLIKSGDVLYVRSNGNKDLIGRCLFFPEVTEKLSFSGFTIRGRVTSKAILPNYLALLSRSEIVKQQFLKNGGGTNISNLSQQILNDVVVPLPAIEEQRKIAKILSTWDKAIATTEKLIETSKQQKKALMQQLLTGKKRLVNPETGRAFEGEWERYSMSELVFIDRKSLGKKTPDDFEFQYISLSDVDVGSISKELEVHKFASAPSRARRVIQVGDILLSTVRPNLKGFAKVTDKYADKIASTGFSVLTPKSQVSCDYIYQYIFSAHITGQIDSLVVGSNYPAINSSDVSGLKVYCPELEEQTKIASVLTATDKEIEVLEAKLAHFKQEKKALMQQLLTGKRRVKVDDAETV